MKVQLVHSKKKKLKCQFEHYPLTGTSNVSNFPCTFSVIQLYLSYVILYPDSIEDISQVYRQVKINIF